MTKNRKSKRSARSVSNSTGMSYASGRRSNLVPKTIVDRNGKITTVYVKHQDAPAIPEVMELAPKNSLTTVEPIQGWSKNRELYVIDIPCDNEYLNNVSVLAQNIESLSYKSIEGVTYTEDEDGNVTNDPRKWYSMGIYTDEVDLGFGLIESDVPLFSPTEDLKERYYHEEIAYSGDELLVSEDEVEAVSVRLAEIARQELPKLIEEINGHRE